MNYKVLLIFVLCIFTSLHANGKDKIKPSLSAETQAKVDSLWGLFNKLAQTCPEPCASDTTRIKLLNEEIGYTYEFIDPDSAIEIYYIAVDLASKAIYTIMTGAEKKGEMIQVSSTDSLWVTLQLLKAKSLRLIGVVNYYKGDYNMALDYYIKALKINEEVLGGRADDIRSKLGMSDCYYSIGHANKAMSYYEEALTYFRKSLEIAKDIREGHPENMINRKRISDCYNSIGNVHLFRGKYDQAINYYLKSVKLFEEYQIKYPDGKDYKNGISRCYLNIGLVYKAQGNQDKALEYFQLSLRIGEEINDKHGLSNCYNNIGLVFTDKGNYDEAISYHMKALIIAEEMQYKDGMASAYNNIANVHLLQGNFDKAISLYLKCLKILEEINNKNHMAIVNGNISELHITMADSAVALGAGIRTASFRNAHLDSAVMYGKKSYDISLEIGAIPMQNDATNHLKKAYTKLGKYKEAMQYAELYISTQDSMFNNEKTKALAEMNTKYESEKKQMQIDKMEAQTELDKTKIEAQQAENRIQQIIIISAVCGFLMMLVFFIIILRMFREKRKANILLAKQNEAIMQQKEEIEAQNDEISIKNESLSQRNEEIRTQRDEIEAQRDQVTAQKNHIEEIHMEVSQSIDYATRLQASILPDRIILRENISDHFVLFRPKDKVSGDFYWWTKVLDNLIITVADCTGHGVPGAFMSMLGVSFLREIVMKEYIAQPAVILRKLRKEIIKSLNQSGESGTHKDGMDMSLLSINTKENTCEWSGANNPIWILRASDDINHNPDSNNFTSEDLAERIEEIKPDKMPIAIYERMDKFTSHELNLNKGDKVYLFSDGFPDQFGGIKGKKFMYKPFKRLLIESAGLSMDEQGERLNEALNGWINIKGETGNSQHIQENMTYEQVDDITVVGIRI